MPTKLNKAGQQQEYVPAGNGDASGEYGNQSGSNKHFDNFKKREIKSFSSANKLVNSFRDSVIASKKAKLQEKGGQQYDAINLDLSKPIHKIDETDRLKYRNEQNAEGYDIAENLIKKYEANVDNIANDILGVTTQQGGVMVGLDFRLKRPDSLTRKLYAEINEAKEKGETLTLQQAADKMGDIARFTSCFGAKDFQRNADAVIRKLQSDGYELVKFKNYFQKGNTYKGLNCNFRDKNGNLFELQFHTPETMRIKEGYEIDIPNRKAFINNAAFQSHDIYEKTRVIKDKQRMGSATEEEINLMNSLNEHSRNLWDTVDYNFPDWKMEQYQQAPKPQAKEYVRGRDGLTPLNKVYKVNDEFFAYKSDGGRWYITDKASGLSAASGKTRKEALDQFNKRTEQIKIVKSRPKYQEQVAKFQELRKSTQ